MFDLVKTPKKNEAKPKSNPRTLPPKVEWSLTRIAVQSPDVPLTFCPAIRAKSGKGWVRGIGVGKELR